MVRNFKAGDVIKTIGNKSSHSHGIGTIARIKRIENIGSGINQRIFLCDRNDINVSLAGYLNNSASYCYGNDVEIYCSNRKEEGAYLRKEAEELMKKAKEIKAKAIAFEKYKDDEDELAHLIVDCMKKPGDVEAIAKLLRSSNIVKSK